MKGLQPTKMHQIKFTDFNVKFQKILRVMPQAPVLHTEP